MEIKEIEALEVSRAKIKRALENGPPQSWRTWERQLEEVEQKLLAAMPALVSELSEAREALRWRDAETELPETPFETMLTFGARDWYESGILLIESSGGLVLGKYTKRGETGGWRTVAGDEIRRAISWMPRPSLRHEVKSCPTK